MNASSTDSHRVCAFRLSCFVFCEITASLPVMPPFGAVTLYFGFGYPRAPDLSEIHARGRGGLQPGASRDCRPPWGTARKPTAPLGVRHGEAAKPTAPLGVRHGEAAKPNTPPGLLHGEVGKPTAPPGLLHGEVGKPTTPPGLLHGEVRKPTAPHGLLRGEVRKPTAPLGLLHGEVRKPTAPHGLLHGEVRKPTAPHGLLHGEVRKPTVPPGLLHGEARKPTTAVAFARPGAFSTARPAGTARFLITRGKASFYETATFGRRKVFFCSPFCGLLFCPARAKLALPAGEKPAAPKPRPPRGGPAQRPRPAPGFCAASANARPGDPAPVRLLEKALWVPPTTEPFRPAPSGKPERKKERRNP